MQIYTITYKKDQPSEYYNYFNSINSIEQKSYLFEYNPLIDIIDNFPRSSELIGIFSWKFPYKTNVFKKKLEYIFKYNSGYDVYNFCTMRFNEKYLQFSEQCHPGFLKIFKELCNKLNLPTHEPKNIIYSNFFVCKEDIYVEFINTIIKPAIDILENELSEQAWQSANYTSSLDSKQLKEQTGLDYYPFHTFLLERLFGQWLETKKYKIYNYRN